MGKTIKTVLPGAKAAAMGAGVLALDLGRVLESSSVNVRGSEGVNFGRLRESILAAGQRVPILVRNSAGSDGKSYEVIDGSQRVAALRAMGAKSVAAVVMPDDGGEAGALALSAAANAGRSDNTFAEICLALVRFRAAGEFKNSADVAKSAMASGFGCGRSVALVALRYAEVVCVGTEGEWLGWRGASSAAAAQVNSLQKAIGVRAGLFGVSAADIRRAWEGALAGSNLAIRDKAAEGESFGPSSVSEGEICDDDDIGFVGLRSGDFGKRACSLLDGFRKELREVVCGEGSEFCKRVFAAARKAGLIITADAIKPQVFRALMEEGEIMSASAFATLCGSRPAAVVVDSATATAEIRRAEQRAAKATAAAAEKSAAAIAAAGTAEQRAEVTRLRATIAAGGAALILPLKPMAESEAEALCERKQQIAGDVYMSFRGERKYGKTRVTKSLSADSLLIACDAVFARTDDALDELDESGSFAKLCGVKIRAFGADGESSERRSLRESGQIWAVLQEMCGQFGFDYAAACDAELRSARAEFRAAAAARDKEYAEAVKSAKAAHTGAAAAAKSALARLGELEAEIKSSAKPAKGGAKS